MPDLDPALDSAVRVLVDDYRERCLWFLRSNYYPRSREEVLRILHWIRGHGDREAFRRSGEIERWLSRASNETSAVS